MPIMSPFPQLLGSGFFVRSRITLTVSDHCTADSPKRYFVHWLVVPSNGPLTELGWTGVVKNCAEGKKYCASLMQDCAGISGKKFVIKRSASLLSG